jgi:SAM-dependent methyltransferase
VRKARPWHEHDDFWQTWMPIMFGPKRFAAAIEQVDDVVALLELKPGARVLDLCCGVGRHSLELARRGFNVTGVDRTRSYLARARKQARAEGLAIEFVRQDMRRFVRPGAFDAAINMFTSFGYFENPNDDARVLRNVHRSLRSGGSLLIDTQGKEVMARKFAPRDWYEQDGVIVMEERELKPDWSGLTSRWIMLKGTERREFRFSLRIYSAVELAGLLRRCGFRRVRVFGSLNGKPYDHTADRLVAVGK